jgi:hypothetical protein
MAMFLCRWSNGDFSIVDADDEDHAVELLDEFANAHSAKIIPMLDCMFDFRLNDRGEIELGQIGSDTENALREACYPELEEVIEDVDENEGGDCTPERLERIRVAVEHERTRQKVASPEPADTEAGDLQQGIDMARASANRVVQRKRAQILESMKTDGKKVQ